MKKLIAVAAILAVLLMAGCATAGSAAAPGQEVKIVIVHLNDLHGHPLAFADHGVNDVSGLPAIATMVKQTRSDYQNVLVLDAGDINTGRPESDFFKAEPVIVGYNAMGVDAMALGNHEFDNSREVLRKQEADSTFPMISANVTTKDGKLLAEAPYVIKTFQGVKVGIFGLTTPETAIIGTPDNVKDLNFASEVDTAKAMVKELREKQKVDVVICLGHMGLYSDNTHGSRAVAAQVSGIDLIIDGHTHSQMTEPFVENGVPIVSAYQWGLNVGRGLLTVENKKVTSFLWAPITINDKKPIKGADGKTSFQPLGPQFDQDAALLPKLVAYGNQVENLLKEKIGDCAANFPNAMSRKAETEIGDLVADAMAFYGRNLKVDFAINNGGGIRADLPAGDITKKSVYTVLPFDNTIRILTIKGADLPALFDFLVTIKQGMGAFPQVSDGVSFTLNYDAKKCEDVLVGGKPIDPNRDYKIATNNYMADGGDGYVVFKKATFSYETSTYQRDALIEYVKSLGKPVAPELKGRIKIIGQQLAGIVRFFFG